MRRKHKKITDAEQKAFIADIVAVCQKHGLTLEPYHVIYDDYDADTGLEISRMFDENDTYYIQRAGRA